MRPTDDDTTVVGRYLPHSNVVEMTSESTTGATPKVGDDGTLAAVAFQATAVSAVTNAA